MVIHFPGGLVVSAGNHQRPPHLKHAQGAAAVTDGFYHDLRLQASLHFRHEFLF